MISRFKLSLLLGLVFAFSYSLGQESILKLKTGKKYKLYFVDATVEPVSENDTIKTDPMVTWDPGLNFLIDDEKSILELKEKWIGTPSNVFYLCWYDYFVYVFEDNVLIDELRINEECKHLVAKGRIYTFSGSLLKAVAKKDKKISVVDMKFDSLKAGRNFVDDAKKTPGIFIPDIQDAHWCQYDGRLEIETNHGEKVGLIEKRIIKKFAGESFYVHQTGTGPKGWRFFSVYCNSNLGQKLKDFKIFSSWQSAQPEKIRLISDKEFELKELISKYALKKESDWISRERK